MVWIRLFVTCLFSLDVAGGIGYLACRLLQKKCSNPYLMVAFHKLAWVMYWCPLPFWLCVCTSIRIRDGQIHYIGEFALSMTHNMTVFFST